MGSYRTLWIVLMLGWTVSAADRALTGPVVTWMIDADVSFLRGAESPYALGGLIGGLFFAGYMLTQWPGGYLGDRYGHRTLIVISLVWAGVMTVFTGVLTGLVAFIALRVVTGLGEGAFYSNDRSLITAQTPPEKRSLGMGIAITGLAIGITIATLLAPELLQLGESVFGARDDAWRMPFLVLGVVTLVVGLGTAAWFRTHERGLPYLRATLHLAKYSAVALAAVMAVYFIGDAAGLSELQIAFLELVLAVAMVSFIFLRKSDEVGPVIRDRDLRLIYVSMFAVLWNLWFFSFWSVSIVADAAESSFARSAMIAAFNAGAGILGFPAGGWLADYAVRRGWGRKTMCVSFTTIQLVFTIAFGITVAAGAPSVWLLAALLFGASLFFNAMQPMIHALAADIAHPEHRGAAFGMSNLIGEMGAVLSPAVSGALRDATGGWTAAVFVDAGIIAGAIVLMLLIREHRSSRLIGDAAPAESRVGQRVRPAAPASAPTAG